MTAQPTDAAPGTARGDMSALVYEAPRVMAVRGLPVPVPGPGEALIRVAYSGICGSELSGFLGESSIRRPPLVFGHEVSGHVVVIDPDAATDGSLEVGTAVTVNPLISCGHCRFCVAGRQQLCPRRLLLGATLPGSNAEFVRVPSSALLPIPAGLSLAQAATVEPAAFALHAVELSGARPASSALVIGAGAIGLLILQVLGEWGVKERFVVERNPTRLAMAVALGSTHVEPGKDGMSGVMREATGGYGVDVAFDAVGSADTRRDCLSSVAAGGTVVLVGLHTDRTELPLNSVVRSEINLTGAFAYSPTNFRTALAWLAAGRIGLRDGIVVAPLHDGQAWFERLIAGDATTKVLLQPQAAPAGDRQ